MNQIQILIWAQHGETERRGQTELCLRASLCHGQGINCKALCTRQEDRCKTTHRSTLISLKQLTPWSCPSCQCQDYHEPASISKYLSTSTDALHPRLDITKVVKPRLKWSYNLPLSPMIRSLNKWSYSRAIVPVVSLCLLTPGSLAGEGDRKHCAFVTAYFCA